MKKIATKFILVATSTFMVGSVMAQTDTTLSPDPADTDTATSESVDTTTSVPESGDGEGVVDTTSSSNIPNARVHANTTTSFAVAYNAFSNGFHAVIDNRELLNNRYAVKTEEEQEA